MHASQSIRPPYHMASSSISTVDGYLAAAALKLPKPAPWWTNACISIGHLYLEIFSRIEYACSALVTTAKWFSKMTRYL